MRELILHEVPDEVVDQLAVLAQQAGVPVEGYAVQELAATVRRESDPEPIDSLPDFGVAAETVVMVRTGNLGR